MHDKSYDYYKIDFTDAKCFCQILTKKSLVQNRRCRKKNKVKK